jgi:hypothetical protein
MSYKFCLNDQEYIFVHIPKTGGSSLERALQTSIGKANIEPSIVGHLTAQNTSGLIGSLECFVSFSFVRNPWAWYVSWYFYLLGSSKNDEDFALEYEHLNNFKNFINFVYKNRDKLVFKRFGNKKYAQFVDWLCLESDEEIDHVFRLEDLSKNPHLLAEVMGLGIKFDQKVNASKHNVYESYYTPELVEMVAEMHFEDIKKFSYSFGGE